MPVAPYLEHVDEIEQAISEDNEDSLDDNLGECEEDMDGLAKVVFPNLEFKVTKRHHRKRWLKQDRVLKLTQESVDNYNVYTGKVSKSHTYSSVTAVKLVNRKYFVLSFKNDHDYHYMSENAIRITWEVNERLKAIESRRRFKNFISRRMSTTNPKHKFSEVFRTNRVPVPVDHQKNLVARKMEGILQLSITNELMDPKGSIGRKAVFAQTQIESLLKARDQYPGLSLLTEVRNCIQDLKAVLCAEFVPSQPLDSVGSSDSFTLSNLSFGGEITSTAPLSPRSKCAAAPLSPRASIRIKDNQRAAKAAVPCYSKVGSPHQAWIEGGPGTEEEVSKTAELCIQKHLLHAENTYAMLYKVVRYDPGLVTKGKALRQKIGELRTKPPSYFGIPRNLSKCMWSDVVREIDLIATKQLPSEKAECLLSMMRQICIVTSVDSGEAPADMTLDEILPICLYCVSRCSLKDPFVEAEYMSLLTDSTSSDETVYYLTVFISALEFLLTLDEGEEDPAELLMTRASSAPLTHTDSSIRLNDDFLDSLTPVDSVESLEEPEPSLSRSSSCALKTPLFDNKFSDVQFVW